MNRAKALLLWLLLVADQCCALKKGRYIEMYCVRGKGHLGAHRTHNGEYFL